MHDPRILTSRDMGRTRHPARPARHPAGLLPGPELRPARPLCHRNLSCRVRRPCLSNLHPWFATVPFPACRGKLPAPPSWQPDRQPGGRLQPLRFVRTNNTASSISHSGMPRTPGNGASMPLHQAWCANHGPCHTPARLPCPQHPAKALSPAWPARRPAIDLALSGLPFPVQESR